VAQADYLVAQIGGSLAPGDLPPFNDFETLDGVTPQAAADALASWNAEIELKLGVKPAIYTSKRGWNLANNPLGNFSTTGLWVANWGVSSPAMPPIWKSWTFWQYTASGAVNGITGSPGVDTSYFHGTNDDLRAYSGLAVPAGFFRGIAVDSTNSGYWTAVYDAGVF